jgi:hypothetical protein
MIFILVVASVAGLVIILIGCLRRPEREVAPFEERFPALSDAEFVARCRPGTDPQVALRVRKVLAESLGVDEERIYPSSRLVQDLGAY